MKDMTVGILGVGHLTSHVVHGFAAKDLPFDILLSPRNAELAAELNSKFDFEIAADNSVLVERSDVVLIGVRQFQAVDVVRGLPWRADQTVVSLCAGLALAELEPHVNGAALVRAMPIIAAHYGESPTCVYPDNPQSARCSVSVRQHNRLALGGRVRRRQRQRLLFKLGARRDGPHDHLERRRGTCPRCRPADRHRDDTGGRDHGAGADGRHDRRPYR